MKGADKPLLVMFLGVVGSGKSYFARQLANRIHAVRFNGDAMRMAMFGSEEGIQQANNDGVVTRKWVFGSIDYATEEVLKAGVSVVYDAQHNKRSSREHLEKLASIYDALPIVVWVRTPSELAMQRAQERREQSDQRQYTKEKLLEVMTRHKANFDEPLETEHVIFVDGQQSFDDQFDDYERQLKEIRKI